MTSLIEDPLELRKRAIWRIDWRIRDAASSPWPSKPPRWTGRDVEDGLMIAAYAGVINHQSRKPIIKKTENFEAALVAPGSTRRGPVADHLGMVRAYVARQVVARATRDTFQAGSSKRGDQAAMLRAWRLLFDDPSTDQAIQRRISRYLPRILAFEATTSGGRPANQNRRDPAGRRA